MNNQRHPQRHSKTDPQRRSNLTSDPGGHASMHDGFLSQICSVEEGRADGVILERLRLRLMNVGQNGARTGCVVVV